MHKKNTRLWNNIPVDVWEDSSEARDDFKQSVRCRRLRQLSALSHLSFIPLTPHSPLCSIIHRRRSGTNAGATPSAVLRLSWGTRVWGGGGEVGGHLGREVNRKSLVLPYSTFAAGSADCRASCECVSTERKLIRLYWLGRIPTRPPVQLN